MGIAIERIRRILENAKPAMSESTLVANYRFELAMVEVADRLAKLEAIAAASGAKVPAEVEAFTPGPVREFHNVTKVSLPERRPAPPETVGTGVFFRGCEIMLARPADSAIGTVGASRHRHYLPSFKAFLEQAVESKNAKLGTDSYPLIKTFEQISNELDLEAAEGAIGAAPQAAPVRFAPAVAGHVDTRLKFRGCPIYIETKDGNLLRQFRRFLEKSSHELEIRYDGNDVHGVPPAVTSEPPEPADYNIGLAEGESLCPDCRGIPPQPCGTCGNVGRVKVTEWSKNDWGGSVPIAWEKVAADQPQQHQTKE